MISPMRRSRLRSSATIHSTVWVRASCRSVSLSSRSSTVISTSYRWRRLQLHNSRLVPKAGPRSFCRPHTEEDRSAPPEFVREPCRRFSDHGEVVGERGAEHRFAWLALLPLRTCSIRSQAWRIRGEHHGSDDHSLWATSVSLRNRKTPNLRATPAQIE